MRLRRVLPLCAARPPPRPRPRRPLRTPRTLAPRRRGANPNPNPNPDPKPNQVVISLTRQSDTKAIASIYWDNVLKKQGEVGLPPPLSEPYRLPYLEP